MPGPVESVKYVNRIVDDIFYRKVSGLTKEWEDKVGDRGKLALGLDCLSIAGGRVSSELIADVAGAYPFVTIASALIASSMSHTVMGLLGENYSGMKGDGERQQIENPLTYVFDQLGRKARATEMVVGLGIASKGVFDIGSYFVTGDVSGLGDAYENLLFGSSLVCNSVSWYVKDSDPKAIDGVPLWKEEMAKGLEKLVSPVGQN